jgi:hypothetical protein
MKKPSATLPLIAALAVCVSLSGSFSSARAQTRINDKDVEHLMSNLHQDVKSFRPAFDAALKKSSIRRTSHEKDARQLAKQFEAQTGAMLSTFKEHKKADSAFQTVVGTAQQLDGVVRQLGSQSSAVPAWDRVQSDLNALYPAFGLTPPTASTTQASSNVSCAQAVGTQRANTLVQQCLQVSTATHPPCNAQNTCKLITDEIRRGCSLIGNNAPSFCAEYN